MTENEPRPRGRPMDRSRGEAILRAVEQLVLERGSMDFAITEVARRARVSTATLYRRWPTREALLLDTIGRLFGDVQQADLGDAYAETHALLQRRHDAMSSPLYLACVPIVFGETIRRSDLGVRFVERSLQPLRSQAAAVYRRAVDRGQFADTIDPGIFVDLVVGPVLRRMIETGAPLEPAFVEQVSRTVVDGLAVRSSTSGRSSDTNAPASAR
jgi:AcrR family transcriptional regulator